MLPNKFDQKIYCLERFIDALVEADVAERPKPPNKAPTVLERLQAEYEAYLREQRGLTEVTVYHCVRFLDRFMKFHFGATLSDRNDITPADIVKFLREVIGRKTTYRIVKAFDDTVGLRTFRLRYSRRQGRAHIHCVRDCRNPDSSPDTVCQMKS